MSKFINPVEIKISSIDLMKILTTHMNQEIFREEHEIMDITMHIKGAFAVTMVVDPVKQRAMKLEESAKVGDKEKKS